MELQLVVVHRLWKSAVAPLAPSLHPFFSLVLQPACVRARRLESVRVCVCVCVCVYVCACGDAVYQHASSRVHIPGIGVG